MSDLYYKFEMKAAKLHGKTHIYTQTKYIPRGCPSVSISVEQQSYTQTVAFLVVRCVYNIKDNHSLATNMSPTSISRVVRLEHVASSESKIMIFSIQATCSESREH